jgi:pimeloyl-ACP methyl ester carboxylesterase
MPVAQLADIGIFYQQYGNGPETVLALHPSTVSGTLFQWAIPKSSLYRVILPDQRGHGRTPNPAPDFRLYRFVTDMIRLMDELGIQQFHGIGYSLGAAVLLGMCQTIPERLKSLVLIGASHVAPSEQQQTLLAGPPEDREGIVYDIMHPQTGIRSGWKFDLERMWEMKGPASIVTGDRDEVVDILAAAELYDAFPNGQLFVVPGCGHFGYHTSPLVRLHLTNFYEAFAMK